MTSKNTYETYNAFQKYQKVINPNEIFTKMPSKPSKNKKFKRNEHRKLPEIGGKWWKMRLKNTYETYNAFKKSQKVSNPDKIWTKMPSKPSKNKKFMRNECRKLDEMNENHTQIQSNET